MKKFLHGLVGVGLTVAAAYAGSGQKYSGIVLAILAALQSANVVKAFNTVPPAN